MAAAESDVSLTFHDVTSSGNAEECTFLTPLTQFLDRCVERNVTVGGLYCAMIQNNSYSES